MPVDEYSDFLLPDNDARTSAVNLSSQEEPAFGYEDGSAEESESLMTDENPDLPDKEDEIGNSDQAEASIGNIDQVKTPLSDCPNQPIRKQYALRRYGKKIRNFQGKWFKEHPWLSFQPGENRAICWACQKFMNEGNFSFHDWKKPERLNKHAKSKSHTMAMTKWIVSKNLDSGESVIDLLDSHHKDSVKASRQYMKIIIESLIFTAQQNIAQRGHEEDRSNIAEVSDVNRGNFIELLHFRSKDISWFKDKLEDQLKKHSQWTSPLIQNEILELVGDLVLEEMSDEARKSKEIGIIVDETSDISDIEQVSVCLRFLIDGVTKEVFVGFYNTKCTEGLALYELIKKVLAKLKLAIVNIVGQCYDGASNMSSVHKGLAIRFKGDSSKAVYVYCYAHRLNLALQLHSRKTKL